MKGLFKNKKFLTSVTILMGTQGVFYFLIKIFQTNYHTIDFFLDSKIPFIGSFIYVYNMFYPFIFLSLYYLYKKDEDLYFKTIVAGFISFLICDIIFIIYPTIMIRPNIDEYHSLTSLVLYFTYAIDTPAINCFPSIHCLFSFLVFFSYIMSNKIKTTKKIIVCLISILIIISTLFVKQHYIYDALGALVLCLITYFITIKFDLYDKICNIKYNHRTTKKDRKNSKVVVTQ